MKFYTQSFLALFFLIFINKTYSNEYHPDVLILEGPISENQASLLPGSEFMKNIKMPESLLELDPEAKTLYDLNVRMFARMQDALSSQKKIYEKFWNYLSYSNKNKFFEKTGKLILNVLSGSCDFDNKIIVDNHPFLVASVCASVNLNVSNRTISLPVFNEFAQYGYDLNKSLRSILQKKYFLSSPGSLKSVSEKLIEIEKEKLLDRALKVWLDIFQAILEQTQIHIVNISLNIEDLNKTKFDSELEFQEAQKTVKLISELIQKYDQLVFVFSAGNKGKNLDNENLNTCFKLLVRKYPNVLLVASCCEDSKNVDSSMNYGSTSVEIASVGYHSVRICVESNPAWNYIANVSGTSFAAPVVSGLLAYSILDPQIAPCKTGEEKKERFLKFLDSCPEHFHCAQKPPSVQKNRVIFYNLEKGYLEDIKYFINHIKNYGLAECSDNNI